ncbi:MAG: hypothetical protein RBT40_07220, partial [Petrimonas sp.]|nr:hypothetical protein [Petrimonas sp.]
PHGQRERHQREGCRVCNQQSRAKGQEMIASKMKPAAISTTVNGSLSRYHLSRIPNPGVAVWETRIDLNPLKN